MHNATSLHTNTKKFTVHVSDHAMAVRCSLEDHDSIQVYNGDVLGEQGFCFTAIVADGEIIESSPWYISSQIYAEIIERYYAA